MFSFILNLQKTVITSLAVFTLAMSLLSCSSEQNTIEIETKSNPVGYQNKNDQRKINIQGYSYTAEQIRQFLYEVLSSPNAAYIDKLLLWGSENKRIGYAFAWSDDLANGIDFVKIERKLKYFSNLTGVEFFRAKSWEEVSLFIAVTSSFSSFKDHHFILAVDKKLSHINSVENEEKWKDLDKSDKDTLTKFLIPKIKDNSKSSYLPAAYLLYKPDLPYDKSSIEKGIINRIASILFLKLGVSNLIETSIALKGYPEPPYIWPFDEALLRIMYGDPNLAGLQLDKAIDQIVETFVQQYGENNR